MATSQNQDDRLRYMTVSDGTRLRYLQVGSGPALVLLHTVRTQLDYFQKVIPKVSAAYTVYALDLPGMGWSEIRAGASYEEPDLRRAVSGFVTGLGLKDITLAGESIGATLALTASTELGDRVRRVVAFNTYDYPEGVERANRFAQFIVKAIRSPVVGPIFATMENKLILRAILRGGFFDGRELPGDFLDELRRSGRRKGYPRVARAILRNLPSMIAGQALYARVSVPVTLVYSDHDWSNAADRQATAALLPQAEVITLREAGHFSALEHPEQVARILLDRPPH